MAAPAAAQTITQLTDHFDASCFSTRPASDGQGVRVVFESNCDLVGTNVDGNLELFSLSQIGLVQITETTSCSNLNPSVSDDGAWIAYDADCNPVGMNVDGSVEIYLTDGAGGTSQLTSEEFCDSLVPSINAAGDLVAIVQHNDPTSGAAAWNLRNDSGQDVVSGIYMYKITAPPTATNPNGFQFAYHFVVVR